MKTKFTFIFLLLFTVIHLSAQKQRTFHIKIKDILYSQVINTTFDSGYLVAGNTYDYGAGYEDIQLVELNKKGDTTWTSVYGTQGSDLFSSVIATRDGGFLVAAKRNVPEILKFKKNGKLQWSKMIYMYAPGSYPVINEGLHGYLIGFQNYQNTGITGLNTVLTELDKNGNEVWHTEFYNYPARSQELKSVLQTPDGYIYTVGQEYTDETYSAFILNKYDSAGSPLWNRIITPAQTGYGAFGNYLLSTAKNRILIAGSVQDRSTGRNNYSVLKFDADGNFLKADSMAADAVVLAKYLRNLKDKPLNLNLYGTINNYYYNNLCFAADGGFVVNTGDIYKTDSSGRVCPEFAEGSALSYGDFSFNITSYPIYTVQSSFNVVDSSFIKTTGAVITSYCSSVAPVNFNSATAAVKKNTLHLQLYPNPADNILVISGLDANTISRLVIADMNGNILKSAEVKSGTAKFYLQDFRTGNYLLKVNDANGESVMMFTRR